MKTFIQQNMLWKLYLSYILKNVINCCQDFFLDEDEDFNLEEIKVDSVWIFFTVANIHILTNLNYLYIFLILHNNNGVLNLA